MAAFSLPDLIHQCRLARWEEEYSIMDTLELPPGQRISYPLLLCAGQEVEFKICASQTVAASIGFEQRETDRDPPEPFIHNPEASCFVIDHELKRTANYLLAVENTSDAGISLTVEISAAKRLASWRTRFERCVQFAAAFFRSNGRFHAVKSVSLGLSSENEGRHSRGAKPADF